MTDTAAAPPERPPLLVLTGIGASSGGFELIRGVDLRLCPGDAALISGPPGSGKSLLLRVAAGLEPVQTGIRVAAPCRTAFVFQEGGLINNITVEENILLPLFYLGLHPAEARRRTAQALEDWGLTAVADDRPTTLVNETRQIAQFARAAAIESELLYLEDPYLSLSNSAAAFVEKWLRHGLKAGKLALLMTSLDGTELADLAPRRIELSSGGELTLSGELGMPFSRDSEAV